MKTQVLDVGEQFKLDVRDQVMIEWRMAVSALRHAAVCYSVRLTDCELNRLCGCAGDLGRAAKIAAIFGVQVRQMENIPAIASLVEAALNFSDSTNEHGRDLLACSGLLEEMLRAAVAYGRWANSDK